MWRSLPIDRTRTSPAFRPARIWTDTPWERKTPAAYRLTDPVAHDLVDGAFIAVHRFHHVLEHRIEDLSGLLGVAVGE